MYVHFAALVAAVASPVPHLFKLPSPCESCTIKACQSSSHSSSTSSPLLCPSERPPPTPVELDSDADLKPSKSKQAKLEKWERELEEEIMTCWADQAW
ncbi:hypothetical protein JCM8097_000293 [Rhodosporidiobolus ruineniae]